MVLLNPRRGLDLSSSPYFTDKCDSFRVRVVFEDGESFAQISARQDVATNAYAQALTEPSSGGGCYGWYVSGSQIALFVQKEDTYPRSSECLISRQCRHDQA